MSNICRGIKNPIGLKCGPSLTADDLLQLIDLLNPENEPGRLTLIGRFGSDKVAEHLPQLVRAVQARGPQGRVVLRPDARQHHHRSTGYKTRPFERILKEVQASSSARAEGTHPGGIHIEMTGKNVTECTGGARAITRRGPAGPLPHPLRSAPQRRPGDRAGLPGVGTA